MKLTDQLDPHEWWGAKLTTDHVFPIADYLYPKLSQLRMTKIPYSDQRNAYKLETTLNQQQWKHESRSLPRWSNTNREKERVKSRWRPPPPRCQQCWKECATTTTPSAAKEHSEEDEDERQSWKEEGEEETSRKEEGTCGRKRVGCTNIFKNIIGVIRSFRLKCWVHLATAQYFCRNKQFCFQKGLGKTWTKEDKNTLY